MPPQRVWFLRLFGLKTGIKLSPKLVWIRVWFSREQREDMNVCKFKMDFEKYFVSLLINNDDIIC